MSNILETFQHPDASGRTVADHISGLVLRLAERKPVDALENFEAYSIEAKHNLSKHLTEPASTEEDKEDPNILESFKNDALNKKREFFKVEPPSEDNPPSEVRVATTLEQSYYWNEMGVGLSEEELIQILLHAKQELTKLPLRGFRLFGKIYGLEQNYYVIEGEPAGELEEEDGGEQMEEAGAEEKAGEEEAEEAKEEEEEGDDAPGEPVIEPDPDEPTIPAPQPPPTQEELPKEERKRQSPNQFVYWVCSGINDPWHRLPDVTPRMLMIARTITRAFTGRLNTPISNTMALPGPLFREKHLLRAQIARISHSTSLIPKLQVAKAAGGEGGEEEEEAEEEGGAGAGGMGPFLVELKKTVLPLQLTTEAAWLHARPPILVQGRVERYPPPPEAGEEEEEGGEEAPTPQQLQKRANALQQKKAAFEKQQTLLYEVWQGRDEFEAKPSLNPHKSLADDQIPGCPGLRPFSIRSRTVAGDTSVLLKSNIWPGAYTLVYGGTVPRMTQLYIGYGKKATPTAYALPPPPPIPEEYEDMDEQLDPTLEQELQLRPKPAEEGAEEEGRAAEEAAEEEAE